MWSTWVWGSLISLFSALGPVSRFSSARQTYSFQGVRFYTWFSTLFIFVCNSSQLLQTPPNKPRILAPEKNGGWAPEKIQQIPGVGQVMIFLKVQPFRLFRVVSGGSQRSIVRLLAPTTAKAFASSSGTNLEIKTPQSRSRSWGEGFFWLRSRIFHSTFG